MCKGQEAGNSRPPELWREAHNQQGRASLSLFVKLPVPESDRLSCTPFICSSFSIKNTYKHTHTHTRFFFFFFKFCARH